MKAANKNNRRRERGKRNVWRRFGFASLCASCFWGTFSGASAFDFKIPLPTIVDAFKKDAAPNGETKAVSTNVETGNDAASTSTPTTFALDLSPSFAKFLPYSVALGRVVCESNYPLEETTGLQAEIVRLQNDLVGYLGVPESKEKISLCLFRDRTSYIAFIC
ncbi:MAG: hypothetical protein IKK39_07095, partial [Thermoguttaceae bacterium]|nr:hypothetical protein [Thermoguttaceae bacterium]